MFGNSYLLLIVRFMNVRALRVMTRYKVKVELSKDWTHIILRGFCWIALQTGAGVELLFSAESRARKLFLNLIPNCYLIVIAPIYSTFTFVFGSRWAMTKVPR